MLTQLLLPEEGACHGVGPSGQGCLQVDEPKSISPLPNAPLGCHPLLVLEKKFD